MGKILESIGIIDGHDIITIGKLKAKNDKIFEQIIKIDKNIQNDIKEIVNKENGRIFAITKKGKIKGLYIFEAKDTSEKKELNHIKTVYTNDVKEDVREKYDEVLLKIAKDYVSSQAYSKVTFEDNIIKLNPKKSKLEKELATLGGGCIGFIFGWLIFDNFMMAIIWGIIFAPIYSGLEVVVTKKRKKKEKTK